MYLFMCLVVYINNSFIKVAAAMLVTLYAIVTVVAVAVACIDKRMQYYINSHRYTNSANIMCVYK